MIIRNRLSIMISRRMDLIVSGNSAVTPVVSRDRALRTWDPVGNQDRDSFSGMKCPHLPLEMEINLHLVPSKLIKWSQIRLTVRLRLEYLLRLQLNMKMIQLSLIERF